MVLNASDAPALTALGVVVFSGFVVVFVVAVVGAGFVVTVVVVSGFVAIVSNFVAVAVVGDAVVVVVGDVVDPFDVFAGSVDVVVVAEVSPWRSAILVCF